MPKAKVKTDLITSFDQSKVSLQNFVVVQWTFVTSDYNVHMHVNKKIF